MAFGKKTSAFGSKLTEGPLGVVQIGLKGWDLGKTTAETTFKPELDTKDIMYQQTGTKAADHVNTGADYILDCTFGEISTELLKVIAPYLVSSNGAVGSDSMTFKADLYESMLDTVAGVLKAAAIVDQSPSEAIEDLLFIYNAIPIIDANLINWGADVQRNLHVLFKCKVRILTIAESATHRNAYGYVGDPTVEDLPAAVWPDLNAPYIVSSVVTLATELTLTLSEDATEISTVTSTEQIVVKVGSKFLVPTVVDYATNIVTLTLLAASISSGDVVEVFVGTSTWEDAENNENEQVDGFIVENNL